MGGAYAGLAALILGQASSSFWLLADVGADEHAAGGHVLCQVRYYQECIQSPAGESSAGRGHGGLRHRRHLQHVFH